MQKDENVLTLKKLRRRSGLTQTQLANHLGLRQGTISDWECGKTQPRLSPTETHNLCQLLGCTLDELKEAFENTRSMHKIESDRQ
ncbi:MULTISPECIES: helix-turn-helix transcriptional regulator [unclassified Thermosynechococcus]|uniref:helix-turn-helix domain-containing protein n=1 Tax=unclassified Thermosynechococcus TaxID=2622553 RepID=UPI0028F44815|nr:MULTISPECIES: helix-turn-helix transcriptional regulator [unclassified Thermosynechococcus]